VRRLRRAGTAAWVAAVVTATLVALASVASVAALVVPVAAAGAAAAPLPAPRIVGGNGVVTERDVTIVGDSILLGATDTIRTTLLASGWDPTIATFPGLPLGVGKELLRERREAGLITNVVVIHLGNNLPDGVDTFARDIETTMGYLSSVPFVVWMNVQTFQPSRVHVNAALNAAAERHPSMRILDWNGAVIAHPEWSAGTNPHLSGSGRRGMAALIDEELARILASGATCRPATNPPGSPTTPGASTTPGPAPATGWLLDSTGRVHALEGAPLLGDLTTVGATRAPVAIAATADGGGYWIIDTAGAVYGFGSARYSGGINGLALTGAPRAIVPARVGTTPDGATSDGYWVLAADGGVFSFGTARFEGSLGATRLNAPIVAIAPNGAAAGGYWLVGADGGVFAFGGARFHGSLPGTRLQAPITAAAVRPQGDGYWLFGTDGGVFAFGGARFHGSLPGLGRCFTPTAVDVHPTASGGGYWIATAEGTVFAFGDAAAPAGPAPALADGVTAVDLALRSPWPAAEAPAPAAAAAAAAA
jgi:hypothetical protein